jgi:hypothetical protein
MANRPRRKTQAKAKAAIIRHPRSIVSRKDVSIPMSVFGNVMKQFDDAAKMLKLDPSLIEFMKMPRRSTIVNLPVRMDDGSYKMFKGYRVQHSIAGAP